MPSADPATGHQRIDHTFAHDELSYDAGVRLQPCVKASFFFRKRPDVSWEHFRNHWASVHADLTVSGEPFARFNVLRYVQHHTSPDDRARVRALGAQPLDYDGCSTLWFRTWADCEAFCTAPSYAILAADGEHIMDGGSVRVYAGHDYIVYGKGIPGIDASNGLARLNTTHP